MIWGWWEEQCELTLALLECKWLEEPRLWNRRHAAMDQLQACALTSSRTGFELGSATCSLCDPGKFPTFSPNEDLSFFIFKMGTML